MADLPEPEDRRIGGRFNDRMDGLKNTVDVMYKPSG
jgi:hypothetical protein